MPGIQSCPWLLVGWVLLALARVAGGAPADAGAAALESGDGDLAWIRFDESGDQYHGTPYYFLGDSDLLLTIDVPPRDGLEIGLLWGAKSDERTAVLTAGGQRTPLSAGGYDGFRWLSCPLPAGGGAAGTRAGYRIRLARGFGRPAFLAAVRLCPVGRVDEPFEPVVPGSGVVLERTPPSWPEAFPERRAIWDGAPSGSARTDEEPQIFRAAERHGRQANESLFRCRRFVSGWLAHADPVSGLIPRNLGRDREIWNPQDAAADNYPFMVLTCWFTDRALFEGRMREMLRAEQRLTSRIGVLPDAWSFTTRRFVNRQVDLGRVIFGASEYVKDGLLPLSEWLGESPWSQRMVSLAGAILDQEDRATDRGDLPSRNPEVNGEMLQSLSRLYWMTGQERFLEGALAIADYYLLEDHHPTRDAEQLRLWDHGCEVIAGLSEAYVAACHARPARQALYRAPIHEMLERILEVGRNEDGLLWGSINPRTGEHEQRLCDTWGYNYNAIYTVGMVDDIAKYRQVVREVLDNLQPHYLEHEWGSADEFADSIEGAINLMNREPSRSAAFWIDSEIHDMWRGQHPDGVIEGWHGDGNVARTGLMYALWKSQGLFISPWREDLRLGAVRRGETLYVSLVAGGAPWKGRLVFDIPRHREQMHLPFDYPRINQFPEWYTVEKTRVYSVRSVGQGRVSAGARLEGDPLQEGTAAGTAVVRASGESLRAGLRLELAGGEELRLVVGPEGR